MAQSNPADGIAFQLDRNKRIDGICDRFELAWSSGVRPRIERYLDETPADDRRPLLVELLASELALRDRGNETCDREEYLQRFPQYPDVVAEAFDRREPQAAQEIATLAPGYSEIIEELRNRLRLPGFMFANERADRELHGLTTRLTRPSIQGPSHITGKLDQQLWLWLIYTSRTTSAADPRGVEDVIRELLNAFPATRRSILMDVLLGSSSNQTAKKHGISERTVVSTNEVAIKLLRDAAAPAAQVKRAVD